MVGLNLTEIQDVAITLICFLKYRKQWTTAVKISLTLLFPFKHRGSLLYYAWGNVSL